MHIKMRGSDSGGVELGESKDLKMRKFMYVSTGWASHDSFGSHYWAYCQLGNQR